MEEKVLEAFSHKLSLLKKIVNDILEHDDMLKDWEVDLLSIKPKAIPGIFELKGVDKAMENANFVAAHGPVGFNCITCFDEDGNPYVVSGHVCPRR